MNARHTFIKSALLILLLFFAYRNIIHAGYIWDDTHYVVDNINLRSGEGLKNIWLHAGATEQYYPVTFTAFWVQYQAWGINPAGYHVVNVVLHLANALLVWWLLARLGLRGAFWAAAVFALHPVHVESVAWITELKNVLSAAFYLMAAHAYLSWEKHQDAASGTETVRVDLFVLSFIFFLFALLSKTVAMSFPAIVLIYLWWKRPPIKAKDVVPLLPFVVTGLIMGAITVLMEKTHVGAQGERWDFTALERLLIAGRAIWFYVGKLFWPSGLSFVYPRWTINAADLRQYVCPMAVIGVLILLYAKRKDWGRGLLAALLFFIVTLIPALGFFNIETMDYTFVADHYQYLASIGIIAATVHGIVGLLGKGGERRQMAVMSTVLLIFAVLTWAQTLIYKDEPTLYSDVIEKNPTCWLAYNNRGNYYANRRLYQLALADYRHAINLRPKNDRSLNNIGTIYLEVQDYKQAIEFFDRALAIAPDRVAVYGNRGLAYQALKKYDAAQDDFLKAIELDRDYVPAYVNLGSNYLMKQDPLKAMQYLDRAASLDPFNENIRRLQSVARASLKN